MPRPFLREEEKRRLVSVKLPPYLIAEVKKVGSMTEIIEKSLIMYLKSIKKS